MPDNTPMGTIVTSYLDPSQFYDASGSNQNNPGGQWLPNTSIWSPADGRPVPGSKFAAVTGQQDVPDLRGVFLRCLNVIDPAQPIALNPSRSDPDGTGRTAGSFQVDGFASHVHPYNVPNWTVSTGNGPYPDGLTYHGGEVNTQYQSAATGGSETRPRNVAVYYYIRIN